MITATVHDDYSGSGRVTQVCVGNVTVWTWAWHTDGPPSADLADLLNTLTGYPSVTEEP